MIPDGRLRDYPFVVVRFACRECPRIGRYRLAVLAERFGADADLATVLEAISASCPRQRESHPGRGCRAYYPDRLWCVNQAVDVRRSLGTFSGDALRHRHTEPGHPVEHRAADPGFGLLGRQSPGAQTTPDDGLVAEHGSLRN